MTEANDEDVLETIRVLGDAIATKDWTLAREAWQQASGLRMIDGIGATEMLHIFISHDEASAKPGATGKPIPGYRACIMDDGGHLIYLERMDGTQIGSVEVAQEKAVTAIRFKRPTKSLEDNVAGGRQVILKLPGATKGFISSVLLELSC